MLISGSFRILCPKPNSPFFLVQISLLYYHGAKYVVSGWYYSIRSKFPKLTLFLIFGMFSYTFPETKLTHFLYPNFSYYLIMGPNKWFLIHITFFEVCFVKEHFSLFFGQFPYTMPKTKLNLFFGPNFITILSWTK